jgi:hypothetical protein
MRTEAARVNAAAFFAKPVQPSELLLAIARATSGT